MKTFKFCCFLASAIASIVVIITNIIYIINYKSILTAVPLKYTIGFAMLKIIVYNLIIWILYFILKAIISRRG